MIITLQDVNIVGSCAEAVLKTAPLYWGETDEFAHKSLWKDWLDRLAAEALQIIDSACNADP